MAKHKTLQEKKRADLRKNISQQEQTSEPTQPQHVSYSFQPTKQALPQQRVSVLSPTTRVLQDIRKTAFVSVVVIALEVLLYLLLRNHILALPFVRY